MKRAVIVVLLYARTAWPQAASGNAHTTGSCSPAVTGNNNSFTMVCQGVPKEKAAEMLRLMNEILKRQLDPNQVYSQLDQLHSAINDLGVTMNPLASASTEQRELIKRSETLGRSCFDFSNQWRETRQTVESDTQNKNLLAMQDRMLTYSAGVPINPGTSGVDEERLDQYRKLLVPELTTYQKDATAGIPRAEVVNFAAVQNNQDLRRACMSLGAIGGRYAAYHRGDASPSVAAVINEGKTAQQDCVTFAVKWSSASRAATRQQSTAQTLQSSDSINQQRSTQYRETLAPALNQWHAQMVTLVPGVSSVADYSAVGTDMQLTNICIDAQGLSNAFRQKVVDDIRNKHKK